MQYIIPFINRLLTYGNFKSSEIPRKYFKTLLTEFQEIKLKDIVLVPQFVKLASKCKGKLIIDDTNHPKYGLKNYARKLKNLKTSGYENGFKILLFLWDTGNHRIPLGFALWHKESKSINELALAGLSRLRNEFKLKPEVVLADGFFCVDKIVKRLTDYGWPFVMRWKSNRKIDNIQIRQLIPRGYGEKAGFLKNNSKVKIFRRRKRFYETNRMMMTMQNIVSLYKFRWIIEETFRVLKVCIGLNRCQQHSVILQEVFIYCCLVAFSLLERIKDHSIYRTRENVISQTSSLDISMLNEILDLC